MSLKPPKKSDLEKDWMTRRRDKVIHISPEYHLIVTEGTDTEPAYFESIKEIINSKYRERIQLDIFGEGDNTLSLFEKARKKAISSPSTDAIRNAKKLDEINKGRLPSQSAPGTKVYELVEMLLPYLR